MKKYPEFSGDDTRGLTDEELKQIIYTKFIIVVPSEEDKIDLMEAFQHIHDSNIDTDYIPVNQLAHQYLADSNIIVNDKLYEDIMWSEKNELEL